MKKTLFLTAILLTTLTGISYAGTPVLIAEKDDSPCFLTGSIYGGYQNNYEWHGIVPSSLLVDNNSFYGGIDLMTRPVDGFSFLGSFTYRSVNDNGALKNHMDGYGINNQWAYNNLTLEDEYSFLVGINQQLGKDWTMTLGYRFYSGGLPGLASDLQRAHDGDSMDGLDHQAEVHFTWNPGNTGFYTTVGGAYSFAGAKGWLLDAGLGYKWEINNRVSAVLSGTAYFSFNYWEIAGKSMKGSDGYQVRFTLPVKITRNFTISPFIAANFEGSNSDHTSAYTASILNASKASRQYTTIAGAEARWTF